MKTKSSEVLANISRTNDKKLLQNIEKLLSSNTNCYIELIKKLDCSNEKQVGKFVFGLVSLVKKNVYDQEMSDAFFLLSELTTNKYFSICVDAMLYCEECPEPYIDYELFKRFLIDPENYE